MTYEELRRHWPNASIGFLKRNATAETVGEVSPAVSERRVQENALVAREGKEEGASRTRLRVVITSYRSRLTDADNLCPKWIIDALRYKQLIPDDSPEHIVLEVRQQKVDSKLKEGTLVEITPCP